MPRVLLLSLLLPPAVVVAAPVPKGMKQLKLDGTWEMVRETAYGKERPIGANYYWIIDGEALTVEVDGRREEPGATSLPRPTGGADNARDYTLHTLNGKPCGSTFPGLFDLNGDTLRFCYSPGERAERPKGFESGPGVILFEFKRVRPK